MKTCSTAPDVQFARQSPSVGAALALSVALALGLALASDHAQADDSADVETARQRFQEGVRYFDKGQFSKARVAFLQAYALKRHPAVLLNLAQSELRTPGHEAIAAQHFAEYLRVGPEDATRAEAEKGLTDARTQIGALVIQVKEAGAEVLVDNEHYGITPVADPIFLKPGTYHVEIRKGGQRKSGTVSAVAGQTQTITAEFGAARPSVGHRISASGPRRATDSSAKNAPRKETRAAGRGPFFPWLAHHPSVIVVAVTAFAGGAGTAAGLWLAAENNERYSAELGSKLGRAVQPGVLPCSNSNPALQDPTTAPAFQANCSAYRDAVRAADRYHTIAYVAGGIGIGALLLVPPIAYWADRRAARNPAPWHARSSSKTRVQTDWELVPAVGPAGFGLQLGGHF